MFFAMDASRKNINVIYPLAIAKKIKQKCCILCLTRVSATGCTSSHEPYITAKLGHLIGGELRDRSSPSTQHYFHYYLVDEQDHQIDSMGVKLSESISVREQPKKSHAILHLQPDTSGPADLTQAFLDKAGKMLDLRNFEKQGLALRIHRFTVEAGRIRLFAKADLTQFPTL